MAAPINLVWNGGFETGNFSGWAQSGDNSYTFVDRNWHQNGDYAGTFGPIAGYGYIAQNLYTVAGETYDLSFWIWGTAYGVPDAGITVQWNGATILTSASPTYNTWTQISIPGLVATSDSTLLSLGFRNGPYYYWVDDVSVTGLTSAPEPATFAIVGAALLGLGLLRRRAH